ncbi:MAG: hypothetical protein HY860_03090 [Chlamydiales bacterium]|nr:hypothetical protein [Chlamydiales bacterium]
MPPNDSISRISCEDRVMAFAITFFATLCTGSLFLLGTAVYQWSCITSDTEDVLDVDETTILQKPSRDLDAQFMKNYLETTLGVTVELEFLENSPSSVVVEWSTIKSGTPVCSGLTRFVINPEEHYMLSYQTHTKELMQANKALWLKALQEAKII